MTSRTEPATHRPSRAGRAAATVTAVGVGLAGLTGCGADSTPPESGAVTVEDLQDLEDQVADLEERVGALEEGGGPGAGGDEPGPAEAADDADPFFADRAAYVGQQVTVSATVAGLVATTDVGGAFRIAGDGSDPITVVSATPLPQLDQRDEVRVTGTALEVRQDSFEQDFGVAADELFEDPDAWFEEAVGRIALSAEEIEVVQEQSDG